MKNTYYKRPFFTDYFPVRNLFLHLFGHVRCRSRSRRQTLYRTPHFSPRSTRKTRTVRTGCASNRRTQSEKWRKQQFAMGFIRVSDRSAQTVQNYYYNNCLSPYLRTSCRWFIPAITRTCAENIRTTCVRNKRSNAPCCNTWTMTPYVNRRSFLLFGKYTYAYRPRNPHVYNKY